MKNTFRHAVSLPGLLKIACQSFDDINDPKPDSTLPLVDHLMSGLALFGLKDSSLLQFDRDSREDEITCHNLQSLYDIKQAPCDTYFRERLDELEPSTLRKTYESLFAAFQRSKGLEGFEVLGGHYLLSVAGSIAYKLKPIVITDDTS